MGVLLLWLLLSSVGGRGAGGGVEGVGRMVFRQVRDMEMWREERRSGEIEGREKENGNCPIRQKTPLN